MPRRKSLIAQMHETRQKAKLQRQKEGERLRRECGRTGQGCGPTPEGGCSTAPGRRTCNSGPSCTFFFPALLSSLLLELGRNLALFCRTPCGGARPPSGAAASPSGGFHASGR